MEGNDYKSVNLPTCMPMFTSYNYKGAAGIASAPNKSFKNWFYNNSVTLSCNRKFLEGYTTPEVDVPHADFIGVDEFEEISYNIRFIKEDIHSMIRKMINEQYYVYFANFDDYYIKGKSNYMKKHMPHDGLICGYNDGEETYRIAAYNEKWIFGIFDTPKKCFEDAMYSKIDDKETYGYLNALKVDDKEVKLDIKQIRDKTRAYLKSNLWNTPAKPGGNAVGIVVHDFIGMYLDKLNDGSIPYGRIDRRVFRMLWEHKECMLKRICAVENELRTEHIISDKYKAVAIESNKIRIMYAKFCMKKNDQLLLLIKDKLKLIKKTEKILLREFVNLIN